MMRSLCSIFAIGALLGCPRAVLADANTDFFESKIRPVLVEHCHQCHSADAAKQGKLKAGLRLDTRDGTRKGGDSGPAVVPGKVKDGTLLASLKYTGDTQMPPKGKLPDSVIADFEKWIEMGAADPRTTESMSTQTTTIDLAAGRQFWAFQLPKKVTPPTVANAPSEATELDRFILAELVKQKLTPVGPADKRTLIRRVYLDLIGLPPTPEEVDAFVKDTRPAAYRELVEKLLASPHHGERWARHWLDVARYAEDQAHTFAVKAKNNAYQYRDWVIRAFNSDMPFDRFVKLQIAGDLMPESVGDPATRFAGLGFIGLGAEYYKNSAKEQAIADELDDRLDTLTRGFLGLTVSCARCHDHKFDPIPTKDYYAIAGIFNGFQPTDVPLAMPDVVKAYEAGQKIVKEHDAKIDGVISTASKAKTAAAVAMTTKYLVTAREIAELKRTDKKFDAAAIAKTAGVDQYILGRWGNFLSRREVQNIPAFKAWLGLMPNSTKADVLAASESAAKAVQAAVTAKAAGGKEAKAAESLYKPLFEDANGPFVIPPAESEKRYLSTEEIAKLKELRAERERITKTVPPMYPVAHVIKGGGQQMKVFVRGNPMKHGDMAPKGFLGVISPSSEKFGESYSRLDLANAIASPNNPLTARVIVNRVWERHFGRGLVGTPSNFGKLGDRPTHPELLDWLTARFIENGWSLKWLHREIVLSTTYQRASTDNPANAKTDHANVYLWRGNRHRLDVEAWRDSLLAVAGTLDPAQGGPTFDLRDANARRRTVYAKVSRHELDGLLRLFDFPDANVTSDKRTVTTVPQQQLFALNSEFMVTQAKAFATRIEKTGTTDAERIRAAYRLAFGRDPTTREVTIGTAFVTAKSDSADKLSRWQQYAQVLLAANEMLYVD